MKRIKLSSIKNFEAYDIEKIINYMLDNNAFELEDDYGVGIVYSLSDLTEYWNIIKEARAKAKKRLNKSKR